MLRGKNAIVTGSTSGIGRGIAQALAEQGCNIVLNGFGEAAEIEVFRRALVSECGVDARHDPADLADPLQVAGLVARSVAAWGSVDILVNNAGVQHVAPIENFPAERWDHILAVNLTASFHSIRAALPVMRQRGWGRIVNIASVHGLVASVNKVAYIAAKHGLVGLTKAVALESAACGVTCNAICPGYVRTPLVERQIEVWAEAHDLGIEAASREFLHEKQPNRRFATTAQIGGLVVFLCSSAAASITGAALPVDGAWTSQ